MVQCNSSQPPDQPPAATASTSTVVHASTAERSSLLATATVVFANDAGNSITIAQTSFISERVASYLSLLRKKVAVSFTGVGGVVSANSKAQTWFIINLKIDPHFCMVESALVLTEVSRPLPSSPIVVEAWSHLEGSKLADEKFGVPARVDALFGSVAYAKFILEGLKKGPP